MQKESKKPAPKLEAVFDRVIVEAEDTAEVSAGGIIIPSVAKARDHIGVVVSVGPEHNEKVCTACGEAVGTVKVGDRVLYNEFSEQVQLEGKKFRVVKKANLLAILARDVDVELPGAGPAKKATWENLD